MGAKEHISCSISKIPFKSTLSFEYLINEVEKISLSDKHPMQEMAKSLMQNLEKVPEFRKPISDRSLLIKNRSLVHQMMAFVVNPLNDLHELSEVYPPFEMDSLYSTSLLKQVFHAKGRKLELTREGEQNMYLIAMIYHSYLIILEKIYDFKIDVDMPFIFKLTDESGNAIKYFKKKFNIDYVEVKPKNKFKKISKKEIKELFDNVENLNLWNEKIPLENFEFQGFLHYTYFDITPDYVISELKSDLLDKNTVITNEGFERIKGKIRALVENPELEFGMAAYNDFESNLNENLIWRTIIPRSDLKCNEYIGTIYEKAFLEKRIKVTDDFQRVEKDAVVDAFLKKGLRSHALVPLILEDEIVGMLEFGSKKPGDLNMIHIKRLHELLPVFALSLKRSLDEWTDKVRAVIQEEFTAIHPTVEWRFREAAANMLVENSNGESTGTEPIIFSDIIPIYGASDVRGSSVERNKAIQSDLTEQLEYAWEILEYGMQVKDMPLLDDLSFKIRKHIKTVKAGLKAGDEVVILDFLKNEIDPVLKLLKERYTEMHEPVQDYFDKLDPDLNVLYKKRKAFEDSLTMINDKVSEILDKEQVKAQDVFPHYFEKYRTDGIEYNGYIGQSMVKDLMYNDIYLKNIRLWQLLVKVKVARKIRELQPLLPTKLDITQLILVHSNPLSIAFRQDEKKFDVAGAYNIRYEITKKRIDKAMINGTKERITQAGKIAIIYSHADEIIEYKNYVDYMISQGYLTNNVEDLELEDLKGASGLRALRVEVDFSDLTPNNIDPAVIEEVVGRS